MKVETVDISLHFGISAMRISLPLDEHLFIIPFNYSLIKITYGDFSSTSFVKSNVTSSYLYLSPLIPYHEPHLDI